MFAQERREQIIEYLKEKKRVEIRDLETMFQVSGATLRTDLRELEKAGRLVRTHGGALYRKEEVQREDMPKSRENPRQKRWIAREAAKYICEGNVIILDSGSTILELARELKDARNLKIVTNDLQIALELQENPRIDLYLVGGRVRNGFRMTQGSIGIEFLKGISAHKVFLSPGALSVYDGAATSNEEMKAVKQMMMKVAGESYMLCDSSKIGKKAFCKFADLSDFGRILIDDGMSQRDREILEKKDVKITICSETEI